MNIGPLNATFKEIRTPSDPDSTSCFEDDSTDLTNRSDHSRNSSVDSALLVAADLALRLQRGEQMPIHQHLLLAANLALTETSLNTPKSAKLKSKMSNNTLNDSDHKLSETSTNAYKKRYEKPMVDQSDSDCLEGPIEPFSQNSKKLRRTFNPLVKQYLIRWLLRYSENPYPSPRIKNRLAENTGLSVNQIEDFFINGKFQLMVGRRRYLKLGKQSKC
jgi:hypothetical protein